MKEKTHILVVDDEQYITQFIQETLEEAGYTVTVANDGNSALDKLAEKKPDLILLDIKMPGLDGYQVLERIRESSDMPIMMLTAVHETTALARSLGLGADDYIGKPFLSKELLARIRAKLRRYGGKLNNIDLQQRKD